MDAVNQLLRFSRNIMGPIIFPGTKWCGTGNVATNFTDLGILRDLDMCCRTHDSCPDVILAEATKYNLTNTSSFTRVSCDCDHSFYNCLKSAHKIYADLVGKTYFVYSRTKCFSSCRTNFE
ncbi:unnamed protein product [Phaedon cochleariae]|uniref:phospholipase A2 n=1 Tax=Phaedon cochleariae TaxID=80249 RepID=A0A9P0DWN9_PHACE|nr:unnamed protein product [Phaedon cochleariae]